MKLKPKTFEAFSPFDASEPGGPGRRGWLFKRDVVVFSAHTFPRTGNLVTVNGVTRTLVAVTNIPAGDIAVCLVDKPYPRKCRPLKLAKRIPGWIQVIHWWRSPQRFEISEKWGYNATTGILWPMPEQEKVEGKPGDSGVVWVSKFLWRWRAVGHTKAANGDALYGPCYVFFAKSMERAVRRMRGGAE